MSDAAFNQMLENIAKMIELAALDPDASYDKKTVEMAVGYIRGSKVKA